MATRSVVRTQIGPAHRFVWTGLRNGDDGEVISIPGAADVTVQMIVVAAGTGDTLIFEGTLEELPATNFFTLRDGGDNLISFTGADGEAVAPIAAGMRPSVTAGDATTNLTAILLARSTMR